MISAELIGIISVLIAGIGAWIAYKQLKGQNRAQDSTTITLIYRRESKNCLDPTVVGDTIKVIFTIQNNSTYVFYGSVNEVLPTGTKLIAGNIQWSGKLLPRQMANFDYTLEVDAVGLTEFAEPLIALKKNKGSRVVLKCDDPFSIFVRPFMPAKLTITGRINQLPIVIDKPFSITLVWQNDGSERIHNVIYRIEYDVKGLRLAESESDLNSAFILDRHSLLKQTLTFTPSEIGDYCIKITNVKYSSINGDIHEVNEHPFHFTVGVGWSLITVDRDLEIKRVFNCLDNLKNGQGHFTILEGDSGIGKSHLISRVLDYARSNEFLCFLTTCMEFNHSLPFHPFRQFLDKLLSVDSRNRIEIRGAQARVELQAISESLKPYTAVLVSNLVGTSLDDKEQSELIAGARELRGQLLIALCRLLEVLSSIQPVVLCIEDLQWADSGTIETLVYLTTHLEERAVYFICTSEVLYDANIHTNRSSLQSLLAEKRRDTYEVIKLDPLNIQEVTELLEKLFLPSEFPSNFVKFIYEETEGNPFYIHELVELMLTKEVVKRDSSDKVWTITQSAVEWSVPDLIDHTIKMRLSGLSDPEMACLQKISLIGREFDYESIKHFSGLEEDDLISFIDKYINMRIIEEIDPGNCRYFISHNKTSEEDDSISFIDTNINKGPMEEPNLGNCRYRFSHNKTCEVIYNDISSIKRKKMHKQLAQVLEETYSDNLSSISAVIATHYLSAEEFSKSVKYFFLAGKENTRVFSNREAIRCFNFALDTLNRSKEEDVKLKKDILFGLASAYREDNDFSNAERVYNAAIDIARESNDLDLVCILLSRKAEANAIQGKYEVAEEIYNEFEALLDSLDDESKNLLLLNDQADLYYWLYKKSIVGKDISLALSYRDKIYEHASHALSIAQRLHDFDAEVRSLKNIGIYYLIIEDYMRALEYYKDAINLAEKHELLHAMYVYVLAGTVYRFLGNNDEAMDNYSKYLSWAERIGAHWAQSKGHQVLGLMAYMRGDYDKALMELEKAVELNSIVGSGHEDIETWIAKGQVMEDLGRDSDALNCYTMALELRRVPGANVKEYSCVMLDIGLEMYARGEIDQARKFFDRSTEGIDSESIDHDIGVIIAKYSSRKS